MVFQITRPVDRRDRALAMGAGNARRALRTAGFPGGKAHRVPAKLWFRVRPEAVWRALQARAGAIHR